MARILVIDDTATVRETVCRLLASAGHDVLEADDGRTGLLAIETQSVDLVVTDIYMPGDDGLKMIRQVRQKWPQLPVITMSGGSRAGNMNDVAVALGALAALNKPFTKTELLDAVNAALNRRRDAAPP